MKTYCAVCHTDGAMNGGLSLEHYDAAKRDPPLAAMILSKLNNGAMGAAGKGVPDKAAQQAWLESTREQAVGASEWFVSREEGIVSVSIVREVPPRQPGSSDMPVYRFRMTCNPSTGAGEMQLMHRLRPDARWPPQWMGAIRSSTESTARNRWATAGRHRLGTHPFFAAAARAGSSHWRGTPSPSASCFPEKPSTFPSLILRIRLSQN